MNYRLIFKQEKKKKKFIRIRKFAFNENLYKLYICSRYYIESNVSIKSISIKYKIIVHTCMR